MASLVIPLSSDFHQIKATFISPCIYSPVSEFLEGRGGEERGGFAVVVVFLSG